ncbi:MAG: heavy-metal-associated domain-containing protein, partial [Flavisolibacter sp.]
MEKVQWKVNGITCANCALTINKYLRQQGAENIAVSPIDGQVSFDLQGTGTRQELAKGIESLGYTIAAGEGRPEPKTNFLSTQLQRFLFCLPFTVLLMLHMIH